MRHLPAMPVEGGDVAREVRWRSPRPVSLPSDGALEKRKAVYT